MGGAEAQLAVQHVTLRPLQKQVVNKVGDWLKDRAVRESFVPAFPENKSKLQEYFTSPTREYFSIDYNNEAVGIIGGENIDTTAGKLEMKKLVGESGLQGKGIGKRATFGFLYYTFMIRNLNKVYIHSRDINIRNINLNSRFGFELEGVFLDDITVGDKRQDVVRMALFKPLWLQIFHLVLSEPFSEARFNSELLMFDLFHSCLGSVGWRLRRLLGLSPFTRALSSIPNEVEESLVFRRCLDFARHDKNA